MVDIICLCIQVTKFVDGGKKEHSPTELYLLCQVPLYKQVFILRDALGKVLKILLIQRIQTKFENTFSPLYVTPTPMQTTNYTSKLFRKKKIKRIMTTVYTDFISCQYALNNEMQQLLTWCPLCQVLYTVQRG